LPIAFVLTNFEILLIVGVTAVIWPITNEQLQTIKAVKQEILFIDVNMRKVVEFREYI